jgi:hypothetical protein
MRLAKRCFSKKNVGHGSDFSRTQPPKIYLRRELDINMQPIELGTTWVERDGAISGAQPNEVGPIGGGPGYRNRIGA